MSETTVNIRMFSWFIMIYPWKSCPTLQVESYKWNHRYCHRIGWWENFNRKALYLMVKTMVSCRFSLKPIHRYWKFVPLAGSPCAEVDDQLPCVAEQMRSNGSQLAFSRAKEHRRECGEEPIASCVEMFFDVFCIYSIHLSGVGVTVPWLGNIDQSPKIVAIKKTIYLMVGWCSMGTFNDPCLYTVYIYINIMEIWTLWNIPMIYGL